MQGEAEQAVLRHALVHFGQHQRDALHAVSGIDPQDAAAAPLGDPELPVGPPGDLPRRVEPLGDDPHRKPLGRRPAA